MRTTGGHRLCRAEFSYQERLTPAGQRDCLDASLRLDERGWSETESFGFVYLNTLPTDAREFDS